MGCDIHCYAERRLPNGEWEYLAGILFHQTEGFEPFGWRCYGMYGFLANVRNYSDVTPICERRGFPRDASDQVLDTHEEWNGDAHSASWISIEELAGFDYDAAMEDRRVTIGNDGGCTCSPGGGEMTTYRKFLGVSFFRDLQKLQDIGADWIVFWFDN